jgi:hypothetical protein
MTWGSLFRGNGLLLANVDIEHAAGELFECQSCHRTMHLTIHGRCSVCNSDAVLPTAKLQGDL